MDPGHQDASQDTDHIDDQDEPLFTALKVIFLVMSIIGLVVLLISCSIRFHAIQHAEPKYEIDFDTFKMVEVGPSRYTQYCVLLGVISLGFIQVYGIYAEHFCIVLTFAILYAVQTVLSFQAYVTAIFLMYFLIASAYLFFAFMIREKQKRAELDARYLTSVITHC